MRILREFDIEALTGGIAKTPQELTAMLGMGGLAITEGPTLIAHAEDGDQNA